MSGGVRPQRLARQRPEPFQVTDSAPFRGRTPPGATPTHPPDKPRYAHPHRTRTGRRRHPERTTPARPPPRKNGFLSPYEGSFHPYGLKVPNAPVRATHSPLRSPSDEEQSGNHDPHDRRTPGAPGSA
ncbi:hypothetical protein GCM10010095_66000 [Streptomyces anthocyanicus]|nr:hypothetical protein GCM10010095_66000 [Streptomyces anthocyanicus]